MSLTSSSVPLGAICVAEPSCPGAAREWAMLWGPEPVLGKVKFAAGFAGDAAGWAALGFKPSLFPRWEPSLPDPKAEVPSAAGLVDQEYLQQPGLAVGSFHPRRARCTAVPVAALPGAARGSHGCGVEQLPTKSLMSTRGETGAHEGSRTCPRTVLELGMETSCALAQGL